MNFSFLSGAYYSGHWYVGNPDGMGIGGNGIERYEGHWRDGKKHGKGMMTTNDPYDSFKGKLIREKDQSIIFEGEWLHGQKKQ